MTKITVPPFNKRGSYFWLVYWALFLWPVAIAYYFMRSWKEEADARLEWEVEQGWHD